MLTATLNSSYGLDGTIKAFFFSGSSKHIRKGDRLKIVKNNGTVTEEEVDSIKDVSGHQSFTTLIHFKNINTPEDAKKYSSSKVYTPRSKAHKLEKGEIYTSDLIGLEVEYNGLNVGKCVSLIDGAQSLLLEIERGDKKRFLLPYMKVFVGDVDIEKGTIELLNGELLEL